MAAGYRLPRGTKAALDTLAGSGSLLAGQQYLLTDLARIAIATSTGAYSLADTRGLTGFAGGKPDASEVLFAATSPYAFTISQAKSSLRALTAATGSAVFTLKRTRSGTTVTVCTFTFSAAGTLATVGTVSNGSIIEGDLLTLEAPATPDATLAGLTATIREA